MPKRILVIDDEENILHLIETVLMMEGFDVKTLSDPLDALTTIDEFDPHLVMTDEMMPGMHGSQLCSKIRKTRSKDDLPVVLLSVLTEAELDKKIKEDPGITAHLPKPFDTNAEIIKAVKKHLI